MKELSDSHSSDNQVVADLTNELATIIDQLDEIKVCGRYVLLRTSVC